MEEFEYTGCPVCQNKTCRRKYSIDYGSSKVLEKLRIKEYPKVYLFECSVCGHHFANPVLKDDYLDAYYSILDSEYFLVEGDFLKKEHERLTRIIGRYLTKGSVLEIGCGRGFLLNEFKKKGWECYGVEPSPTAVKFAVEEFGLDIKAGVLTKDSYPRKFDLIILLDVIEHLKYPGEMISMLHDYLRPKGLLVIGTGNISSINAKISGRHWGYYGSWEHISFFNRQSMRYLLKKYQFDCKIIGASYREGILYNIDSLIQNVIVRFENLIKLIVERLVGHGLRKRLTRLAFDHMIVIGQRS